MKALRAHTVRPSENDILGRISRFLLRISVLCLCAALGMPVTGAESSLATLTSLPETNVAASFVSSLTESALPEVQTSSLRCRAAMSLIETGFLIGATTAVHELGHARRVRALGGGSRWETGDRNWYFYLTHRVPLSAGATEWHLPYVASVQDRIMIAAGGFNATTAWDESQEGRGPLGLVSARYSTLFYMLSGIGKQGDDLAQLSQLYSDLGYTIPRREMQAWQLAAGLLTQLNHSVRAYAYFTPKGVSLKTATRLGNWTVGAETVVHGRFDAEFELGRRIRLGHAVDLVPQVLLSQHGLSGALKAGVHLRNTTIALGCQWVNDATLLGSRTTTNFDLGFTHRL